MLTRPPFHFMNYSSSLAAAPAAANPGIAVVSSATANTDGSSVTLITALAHDVHYLIIGVDGFGLSARTTKALLDILIDPAGGSTWVTFIDDLVCGFGVPPSAGDRNITRWYHFPIFIKAGASLGIRVRTADAAARTGYVVAHALGDPSRPDAWWCGSKVESLGINAATSAGTDVNPGTSAGVFGSWTNIGTTTAQRYGAVQLGLNGSDATALACVYYWQMGYASLPLPNAMQYHSEHDANELSAHAGFAMPIFCDIPAATQMQARGMPSVTGSEIMDLAIYGCY